MAINDDLNSQADYYGKIDDNVKDINDNLLDIENTLGAITKKINNVAGVFGTTLSIGTFASISKQLWDIDKASTQISVRMGKGKEGAKELKTTIKELQVEFGASAKAAQEITSELAKKNYVGNLQDAAKAAYLLHDATGLSVTETTELTDTLSKVVGLSEKSIGAMFAGITKVQQANGISDRSMSSLANHIGEASTNMKAFGKSDDQIKQMSVSTAKLVSSFEKVGISARTALDWVERLTDPDRIEENIGLYSQLGISMSDALGGADISGQLEIGMKEFGQKLKNMGPIAGAQYAKSFGVSYKEAIKAANAENVTIDTLTPEEQSLDALKKLSEETHNITRTMEVGFNKVTGWINGLGPVIMTLVTFGSALVKKKLRKGEEELASVLGDGIRKGVEKGTETVRKNAKSAKGFIGSLFDSSALAEAQSRLDKVVEESGIKLSKHSSIIIGGIEEKIGNAGLAITRWVNPLRAFSKNREAMANAYWQNEQNSFIEQYQQAQAQIQELNSLEGKLSGIEETRRLKALSVLEDKQKNLFKYMDQSSKALVNPEQIRLRAIEQETAEIGKQQTAINNQIAMYNSMEVTGKAREKVEEKIAELQIQAAELGNKSNNLNKERERIETSINSAKSKGLKTIEKEIEENSKNIKKQQKSIKDYEKKLKKEKEGTENAKNLNKKLEDARNSLKQSTNEAERLKKELQDAAAASQDIGDSDSVKKKMSSIFGRIVDKLGTTTDRQGMVRSEGGKGVAKNAGKLAIKGLGGIGKILRKLTLSMGLLTMVTSLLQKPLESMKNFFSEKLTSWFKKIEGPMNGLTNGIMDFFDSIFPQLSGVFEVLINNILFPLIRFFLPKIIKVIGLAVTAIGGIMKPLGMLISLLKGGKQSSIEKLSDSLMSAGTSMMKATFNFNDTVSRDIKSRENESESNGEKAQLTVNHSNGTIDKSVGSTRQTVSAVMQKSEIETRREENTARYISNINSNIDIIAKAITNNNMSVVKISVDSPAFNSSIKTRN